MGKEGVNGMNMFENLTQEKLKIILTDVLQRGENLQIDDGKDMIDELKRQILTFLNQNNRGN
jgi:polyhydroxyalkanoate synthesis regulator phasin